MPRGYPVQPDKKKIMSATGEIRIRSTCPERSSCRDLSEITEFEGSATTTKPQREANAGSSHLP